MNKQDLINKYTAKNEELRPNCPNRNRKNEELKRTKKLLRIWNSFTSKKK